ncbi:Rossmann-like and DUF2520 domain-containing protein [Maribacter algicola]|uniref:Rossmann-like and DUF2520 domain-containing protein n=1 Tax=Meishania litoralis TaxID=3434685 RepID=A0ACC7LKF3_9FLAO
MIKIAIIGNGNVGSTLNKAFSKAKNVQLVGVINSRLDSFEIGQVRNTKKESLSVADSPDLYILAVSDDAIVEVSKKLKGTKSLVVHTSGSVAMKEMPVARKGVLYPLQTFSKESLLDLRNVPLCIETEKEEDFKILQDLATALSKEVYKISSKQRAKLHLAAVFVNNFVNHMYKIGSDICLNNDLSFSMLKPLISETAKKVEHLSPETAQTGPARRADTGTIEKHLDLLSDTAHKEIYSLMTRSIQKTYEKEL